MDPHYRTLFNSQFTPALYERYKADLARRCGCTFEFRLAESPVFLPDDFLHRATTSAQAIIDQLSCLVTRKLASRVMCFIRWISSCKLRRPWGVRR